MRKIKEDKFSNIIFHGLKNRKDVICKNIKALRTAKILLKKYEVGGGLDWISRLTVELEEFQKPGSGIKRDDRPAELDRMSLTI